jgi:hypothetical protein
LLSPYSSLLSPITLPLLSPYSLLTFFLHPQWLQQPQQTGKKREEGVTRYCASHHWKRREEKRREEKRREEKRREEKRREEKRREERLNQWVYESTWSAVSPYIVYLK